MIRRGVVHTLDSFLAAIIIFTALLFASEIPRERDYTEDLDLNAIGMQVLVRLDCSGNLGRLVAGGDWDELERILRISLPARASFNLTIFDEQGVVVNSGAISNGGVLGRRIFSVEYLLAVESDNCPIYKLRLQLGG
ncbi:MAG: hypothetical protein PVH79_00785 [Candidatus Bathyarchaeota archaeon]|jgi:hypothetical protein